MPFRVEAGHEGTGGAHAEHERLPPVVEARMLDVDRKRALLDLTQPGFSEELRQVPLAGTREL